MTKKLLLGQTLAFTGNPFTRPWDEVARHSARGAVLIDAGRIVATGEDRHLWGARPRAGGTAYGRALVPGRLVDQPVQLPRTAERA